MTKPKSTTEGFSRLLKVIFACAIFGVLTLSCSELEKPKTEPFYAQTAPPQVKEFRWSNGRMPKSFDPARAESAPETDIVRAIFEGLTDTDQVTLEAIPAVAEKWTSSADYKTWTFTLRKDAKWSNGERVTANDFVRSWRRVVARTDKSSVLGMLDNIVGVKELRPQKAESEQPSGDLLTQIRQTEAPLVEAKPTEQANKQASNSPVPPKSENDSVSPAKTPEPTKSEVKFGVDALGESTLRVRLVLPDRDFPALVAHPILRPVHGDGASFSEKPLDPQIVTNGAFTLSSVSPEGIEMTRSEIYWDKEKVAIERVRIIPKETAEQALEAYRKGEVDAVTNASFEPLLLKLLAPYDDFKRMTHGALNFYEFNLQRKPFDDRRVREAFAIAIDRDRLSEIEMDGATRPASGFLPFTDANAKKLAFDKDRAKELLAEAGFEDGEDFPVVRLVINRNEVQQRIARAVIKMWKQALNVDAVLVVRESSEIESAREAGDFDLIRRGVILPTSDETAGMLTIFAPPAIRDAAASDDSSATSAEPPQMRNDSGERSSELNGPPIAAKEPAGEDHILTVAEAFEKLPAIPLYFPTSYSLVKPYVQGFEINTLDAPSLKEVRIDNNWQPKKPGSES